MSETIKPCFHHVTLKTSRLLEMLDWYRAVVGMEVVFQNENNAWVTNDEANHRLGFLSAPSLRNDPDRIVHNGMHHFAFEYGSFSDLMSSYDRLKRHGTRPAFGLNHGSTVSLYYLDPEHNYVELQSDNFSDWKLSGNFIRTSDDFRSNPVGTFFDPERVFVAYAGGRPIQELYAAMREGDFLPDEIPGLGMPSETAEMHQDVL